MKRAFPGTNVPQNAYFVSASGSDSNSGRSPLLPFLTISHAHGLTVAGDTVYVMNGTYHNSDFATTKSADLLHITRSGTATSWITYKNYPGHKPILDFNGWHGINITANYIVIDGFEISGPAQAIDLTSATADYNDTSNSDSGSGYYNGDAIGFGYDAPNIWHHCIVQNCLIHDACGQAAGVGRADYFTVQDCVMYNCAWWTRYGESGVSIFQPRDSDSSTGTKIIVQRNIVHDCDERIPWKGGGGTITDGEGIIVDTTTNNTGVTAASQTSGTATLTCGSTGVRDANFYTGCTVVVTGMTPSAYNGTYVVTVLSSSQFTYTVAGSPGAGTVFGLATWTFGGRTLVQNNLSYNNGHQGISIYSSAHTDIINNTVYLNSTNSTWSGSTDPDCYFNHTDDCTSKNNIIWSPSSKKNQFKNATTNLTEVNNLYFNGTGTVTGTGNSIANPVFVTNGSDFHLQASSPAVNAGTLTGAPTDDLEKKTRDATPDKGCYER